MKVGSKKKVQVAPDRKQTTTKGSKKKVQVAPDRKQTTTKVNPIVKGATWIKHTHDARFREDISLG
ncbi:hypothetical protein HanHA89_Chr08g0302571 [Helianthus annuus]|nr:hypothetical protein HanHA89_Chr08g0302571 [Helianthus annuus]